MLFKYFQVNVVSGQLTLRRFLNWISLSSVSCLTRSDLYALVKLNGFYMQTEAIIWKAYSPQLPPKALLHLETWYHQVYHLFFLSSLSDQISRSVVSDSLQPHESQHARPPCPSPTPGVHADSRPSSRWCHPAISSSVVPFSSCPQSLPASESLAGV